MCDIGDEVICNSRTRTQVITSGMKIKQLSWAEHDKPSQAQGEQTNNWINKMARSSPINSSPPGKASNVAIGNQKQPSGHSFLHNLLCDLGQ